MTQYNFEIVNMDYAVDPEHRIHIIFTELVKRALERAKEMYGVPATRFHMKIKYEHFSNNGYIGLIMAHNAENTDESIFQVFDSFNQKAEILSLADRPITVTIYTYSPL